MSNKHLLFYIDDNQDSFRELGGNEALLNCLKNCEKLFKDAVFKALANVVNGNGKDNIK